VAVKDGVDRRIHVDVFPGRHGHEEQTSDGCLRARRERHVVGRIPHGILLAFVLQLKAHRMLASGSVN
jgi:hypothetical protein